MADIDLQSQIVSALEQPGRDRHRDVAPMWGAQYFASGPFAGVGAAVATLQASAELALSAAGSLTATARLASAASLALGTVASLTIQIDLAAAAPRIAFGTSAELAAPYGLSISIDGVETAAPGAPGRA